MNANQRRAESTKRDCQEGQHMFYLQTETRCSDRLNRLNRPGSWLPVIQNSESGVRNGEWRVESRYPGRISFSKIERMRGEETPNKHTQFALILAFVSSASCGSWQQVICITISGLWFDFQLMVGRGLSGYLVTWAAFTTNIIPGDSSLSQRLSGSQMTVMIRPHPESAIGGNKKSLTLWFLA